jgi:dihydrolipoamide dehydrogenase
MEKAVRDLIVLGSGPGGYVAAIRAAQLGRKVTIIERDELGGVCLNWGCIPSKTLLASAKLFQDIKQASKFGFSIESVKVDFPKLVEHSRSVAGKLSGGVKFLMKKNGVEVLSGGGVLQGQNTIAVTDSAGTVNHYSYQDIIIATGAAPKLLPGVEIDGETMHTSRTILESKRLPQKMLIIGAGAIGVEFAYFFHALGVRVTLVEIRDQILPHEDADVASELQKLFERQGMLIETSACLENLKQSGKVVTAAIRRKDGEDEKWSGDCCLLSVGVTPNISGIGLEKAGIQTDGGCIQTDAFMATNVPRHFAIGDVSRGPALAHKASHSGLVAAEAACGRKERPMRYDNIPACTYCQPQVASVGVTEQAAKQAGLNYKCARIPFSAVGKAIAVDEPEGFLKAIIDQDTGEVLGVHIFHAEATELISEAAVIRSHEGVAASVLETIHPHPTLSEAMMEAMALALGRPINV